VRIRVGITIAAEPARVWSEIDDISRHVEWMKDAESIEFLSRREQGVDTTFVCVTRIGPFRTRDVMTVTEWKPRRVMGIRHEGVVRGQGRFTLRRKRGGRTRFTWRESLTFPWWAGGPIGALLAKPFLRHVWKRNLRRLRLACES
jgi:hypothetical protein